MYHEVTTTLQCERLPPEPSVGDDDELVVVSQRHGGRVGVGDDVGVEVRVADTASVLRRAVDLVILATQM